MARPLLSVIVPVYKAEKYIDRCINSILNQTLEDLELILVDDGSPDNSGAICDEYAQKDARVKVFHQKTVAFVLLVIQVLTTLSVIIFLLLTLMIILRVMH